MDGVPLRIEAKRYTMHRAAAHSHQNRSPITFADANYQSPYLSALYYADNTLSSSHYPLVLNYGAPMTFAANHTLQALPTRGGPTPHYGDTSNMSPYTQCLTPNYTSPLTPAPHCPDGSVMYGSPMHYSNGGNGSTTPYYGSYVVSGPSCTMAMGPVQPIAELGGGVGEAGGF
jgi:hypothetical protein